MRENVSLIQKCFHLVQKIDIEADNMTTNSMQ